jgi:hypothetical protein
LGLDQGSPKIRSNTERASSRDADERRGECLGLKKGMALCREPIKKQFLKFFHRAGQEAALNVQGSLQEGSGR